MKQSSYDESQERHPNQRETTLKILKEAGRQGITNVELNELCPFRWDSRVRELVRLQGCEIHVENEAVGIYRYYLLSEPNRRGAPEKGIALLKRNVKKRKIKVEELEDVLMNLNLKIVRSPGYYKNKYR